MIPRQIASIGTVYMRQAFGTPAWHIVLRDPAGAALVAVPCASQDEARRVAALSAAAHGARLEEE